jgi:hypothetical protein
MNRFVGRFSIMDGVHRRVADEALKTHVASFHGNHFVAEREGQNLHIHMLHEQGQPIRENTFSHQEGASGIRSSAGSRLDTAGVGGIGSITELNELNRKAYAGLGIVRRRA